jgi:hypothetical protein
VIRHWPRRTAVVVLTLAIGVASAVPAASAPAARAEDDDADQILAFYDVQRDALGTRVDGPAAKRHPTLATDEAAHRKIWELFASLTPPEYEGLVVQFQVISDDSDTGAYVSETEESPTEWVLGVDAALVDRPHELRYTLVHEFAHLVSLNAAQVPTVLDHFRRAERECTTFYTGEGCSLEGSYIFQFVDRFWDDRLDEWYDLQDIENDRRYDDAIFSFYERHQNEFVTDYAASDPVEDFAESFAHSVLREPPTRSRVRDDKVRFFSEFPELVALRDELRTALGI